MFDGAVIFELPPASDTAAWSQVKSMQGMDKHYNGHVWTKTITTNIKKDFGLSFRYSACVGHLRCNKECEYLNRRPRIFQVNETKFEGCTLQAFVVDQSPQLTLRLFARYVKNPRHVLPNVELRFIMWLAKATRPECVSTSELMMT